MKKIRRQSPASQPSSLTIQTFNPEEATILSAMEYFTSSPNVVNDDENDIEEMEAAEKEISAQRELALAYLQNRLGLTAMQTKILTHIVCYNAEHPSGSCDNEDLAHQLGLHPLRVMQHMDDINHLEELGYIEICTIAEHGGKGFHMIKEAMEALTRNEAFDIESLRLSDNLEFLGHAQTFVKNGMRYDRDGCICKNIQRLMQHNTHLSVVKHLQQISNAQDMWFMLLMLTTLAVEGDDFVSPQDIEQILHFRQVRSIVRLIGQGKHPFMLQGYISYYNQDTMAQANQWVLTRKAWTEFLENEDEVNSILSAASSDDPAVRRLTPYTSLVHKQLFFSGKTHEQVERLTHLLQEEQYLPICEALKRRGMPTGFCCLFYGTPGTGKTELVQQLAIATQRDLFQVDLSTLRDKFVGESEKQIKEVFDTYRSLVKTQEHAPILFFNEADAIFGNRMENTQRSVDKMENAIQNIILQEMESLNGIMICTTNLTTCLDKAFDRRFLFKLEFEKPTNEARKQIWQSMLEGLNDEQATYLANHFDFSGGQIQNISRKQVINAIFSGTDDIDYEQVKLDCQNETISRNNGRKIGF